VTIRAEWERIWIDDQEVTIARDRFLNARSNQVSLPGLWPQCPAIKGWRPGKNIQQLSDLTRRKPHNQIIQQNLCAVLHRKPREPVGSRALALRVSTIQVLAF
jgi:hypothetical protein